jgi:hypothetical protein
MGYLGPVGQVDVGGPRPLMRIVALRATVGAFHSDLIA